MRGPPVDLAVPSQFDEALQIRPDSASQINARILT
jgi:hypothetical protein